MEHPLFETTCTAVFDDGRGMPAGAHGIRKVTFHFEFYMPRDLTSEQWHTISGIAGNAAMKTFARVAAQMAKELHGADLTFAMPGCPKGHLKPSFIRPRPVVRETLWDALDPRKVFVGERHAHE